MVMGYVYVHHTGSGKIVLLIYGRYNEFVRFYGFI